MSTKLRTSKLIDNCTPSISYDRQVQAACTAFDNQCYQIIDDTGQVLFIPYILNLPEPGTTALDTETLLDILAWQFHVDFYDKTKPFDFRKQLVQMSIQWHMTKGTVALVQWVLDTYFPQQCTLQEWFEYRSEWGTEQAGQTFNPSAVNVPNNKFNISGFSNGDGARFDLGSPGNVLPAPIQTGVIYTVMNATTNSFQISEDEGATVLVITTNGTGTNNLYRSPAGNWPPNYPINNTDTQKATFGPSNVDIANDRFNINGHGLTLNQQIKFIGAGSPTGGGGAGPSPGPPSIGGLLPNPIVSGIFYYVANPQPNSFQVSPSPWTGGAGGGISGSVINLIDTGTGSNNQIWTRGIGSWHDRYRFRVLIDSHFIDPTDQATALKLIDRYKPISRWMEGFVRQQAIECDIGWCGMLLRFIYREIAAPIYGGSGPQPTEEN